MATPDPGLIQAASLSVLVTQGADPDLRIPADTYVPPVHTTRSTPDDLLAEATTELAVKSAVWSTPGTPFPYGPEWLVDTDNAAAWAHHRFEGHFSEQALRHIADPEGHPLFELRLDILEFEVLFHRFITSGRTNLGSVRLEVAPGHWGDHQVATVRNPPGVRCLGIPYDDPHLLRVPLGARAWVPACPHLRVCLGTSRSVDYAAGLALYLRTGREHWGIDPNDRPVAPSKIEEAPDAWDTL